MERTAERIKVIGAHVAVHFKGVVAVVVAQCKSELEGAWSIWQGHVADQCESLLARCLQPRTHPATVALKTVQHTATQRRTYSAHMARTPQPARQSIHTPTHEHILHAPSIYLQTRNQEAWPPSCSVRGASRGLQKSRRPTVCAKPQSLGRGRSHLLASGTLSLKEK